MSGMELIHVMAGRPEVYLQVNKGMSIQEFLTTTSVLINPVDAYFEKVFVMTDDQQVKNNRLAMLRQIAALSDGILDFTQLPGF